MTYPSKPLNPDFIKSNLVLSALYLTAYELLKDTIVDRIRSFYSFEYRDGHAVPDAQYQKEVLSVHKDILVASCLWLNRTGVIAESEVEEIQLIRTHRNQIAHELPRLLVDPELDFNVKYFLRIRELLQKIETWWVKNVDIPSNSDFDGVEVDERDIETGRVVILDYVISVALADYRNS